MQRVHPAAILIAVAVGCTEPPLPSAPVLQAGIGRPELRFSATAADDARTYLVRFRKNAVPADLEATVGRLGGEVIFAHAGVGLAAVSGLDAAGAKTLGARGEVASVLPDMYTVIDAAMSAEFEALQADRADAPASAAQPNTAFFFPRQWHLRAIRADAAWASGKLGKSTTRVGILDTGIGYTHLDLIGRVDLAASRSFLSAAENARVTAAFGASTNLVADLHFHGTLVAGTVASNAIAIAGVTSGVTLVGLKVCAPGVPDPTPPTPPWQATCPTSAVFGALLYAADIGLDVVNISLGGAFNRRDASARGGNPPSFLAIINSVFNYVHQQGTTVVVAAGNDARDMDHDGNLYNAYCDAPHVVCVSATGPTAAPAVNGPFTNVDAFALYSNHGRSAITVAAPGGNGLNSTPDNPTGNQGWVWGPCSRHSLPLAFCQTGTFIIGINGTSFAAPHAAGVASLIAGEIGRDVEGVRHRLTSSSDDLGLPGVDPLYGRGRVNAARAVGVE